MAEAKLPFCFAAQDVDRLQFALGLEVPERPAVARRLALNQSAQAMNRCLLAVASKRAVGADFGANASARIKELLTSLQNAEFQNLTERNARLTAL